MRRNGRDAPICMRMECTVGAFIALLGAAITASRTLRAQQKAMPVIGWLIVLAARKIGRLASGRDSPRSERSRLRRGPEHDVEARWAEGHYDRLPALAGTW